MLRMYHLNNHTIYLLIKFEETINLEVEFQWDVSFHFFWYEDLKVNWVLNLGNDSLNL